MRVFAGKFGDASCAPPVVDDVIAWPLRHNTALLLEVALAEQPVGYNERRYIDEKCRHKTLREICISLASMRPAARVKSNNGW